MSVADSVGSYGDRGGGGMVVGNEIELLVLITCRTSESMRSMMMVAGDGYTARR